MIRKLPQGQETPVMIRLTRLNKRPLVVNSDLLKFIENTPDTVITLVSGEKIVVLETTDEVIARVVEFRQRLGMQVIPVMPFGTQATHPEATEPPPTADDSPDENA
jgi:flagellar protein FlbD